jgi:hypothetical protein
MPSRDCDRASVNLALHPNCGTNLLTSAGMVAASLWFYIQLLQARRKVNWADFSTFVLIGLVALVLSRPLGMWLQRHVTTKADLENLTLLSVKTIRLDPVGAARCPPLRQHSWLGQCPHEQTYPNVLHLSWQ